MQLLAIRAHCVFAAACGLAVLTAQAQTNVTPPTAPVLTCNANSTTSTVVKNVRDAFNTSNQGTQYKDYTNPASPMVPIYTFPQDSRPYWQAAVEKRALWTNPNSVGAPTGGSDGVTGSRNVASATFGVSGAGFYDAYPTMPPMDGNWVVMGDVTTSGFNGVNGSGQQVLNGQLIGMANGQYQLNHNPNVMYYYKFTFTMDSLMDVNQFGIKINNMSYGTGLWNNDDRLKGIYINGQLAGTTNNTGDPTQFVSTSSSYNANLATPGNTFTLPTNTAWKLAHPAAQPLWTSGSNTIVFAILNGGMRNPATNTDPNFADSAANTGLNDPSNPYYGNTGTNTSLSILKMLDNQLVQDCTPVVSAPATAATRCAPGSGRCAAIPPDKAAPCSRREWCRRPAPRR